MPRTTETSKKASIEPPTSNASPTSHTSPTGYKVQTPPPGFNSRLPRTVAVTSVSPSESSAYRPLQARMDNLESSIQDLKATTATPHPETQGLLQAILQKMETIVTTTDELRRENESLHHRLTSLEAKDHPTQSPTPPTQLHSVGAELAQNCDAYTNTNTNTNTNNTLYKPHGYN